MPENSAILLWDANVVSEHIQEAGAGLRRTRTVDARCPPPHPLTGARVVKPIKFMI
jgi:hypothetical protein